MPPLVRSWTMRAAFRGTAGAFRLAGIWQRAGQAASRPAGRLLVTGAALTSAAGAAAGGVGYCAAPGRRAEREVGSCTEPYTGAEFPARVRASSGEERVRIGASVRCMMGESRTHPAAQGGFLPRVDHDDGGAGLCNLAIARAYAFALYLDPRAAPGSPEAPADDEEVLARLNPMPDCSSGAPPQKATPMTLRLVFARNVEGGHIAKGFDRSLLHRIRQAQGGKVGGGKDDLRALVHELKRTAKWDAVRGWGCAAAAYTVEHLRSPTAPRRRRRAPAAQGTVMDFERDENWHVVVRVDGAERLRLASPALGWALFDAYVGETGHFAGESRTEVASSLRAMPH